MRAVGVPSNFASTMRPQNHGWKSEHEDHASSCKARRGPSRLAPLSNLGQNRVVRR